MKYLKKFETISAMTDFKKIDDVISYVKENDKVYVRPIYKICNFTIHLDEEANLLGLFALDSRGSTIVDAVTIDDNPINMDNLLDMNRDGSSSHMFAYAQHDNMIKDHIVYSVPTRADVNEISGEFDFDDFADVWIDRSYDETIPLWVENVRYVSDDSLVMITINSGNETIVRPLHPSIMPTVDELPDIVFYFKTDEEDFSTSIYVPYQNVSVLVPYSPGDYEIVLYSFDKNFTFNCGYCALYPEMYLHYTLSKNVTKIASYSFGAYAYYLTEIWYEGTMDDFNAIEKANGWNLNRRTLKTINTVHCVDGDLSV